VGVVRKRVVGTCLILALTGALTASLPATAAPPTPAPVEDDLHFLQVGALAEQVSIDLYTAALGAESWTRAQRATFRALRRANRRQARELITALGVEAPVEGDFEIVLPGDALRTKGRTLALARSLERLAIRVYTSGAQEAQDPGTRLLLARLLAQDVQHLSTIAVLRGSPPITELPGPIGPERAATAIDRFLTVPESPPIPE
jgi:Ferritin-like domain